MATDEYGRAVILGVPTGPREVAAALSAGEPPKVVPRPNPIVPKG